MLVSLYEDTGARGKLAKLLLGEVEGAADDEERAALLGRASPIEHARLFVLFLALRSIALAALENPEPRYTLVCYPILLAVAAKELAARLATADPPRSRSAPPAGASGAG